MSHAGPTNQSPSSSALVVHTVDGYSAAFDMEAKLLIMTGPGQKLPHVASFSKHTPTYAAADKAAINLAIGREKA